MTNMPAARRALDVRLAEWRGVDGARPHRGWLRAVRDGLGMTLNDLAARMGVSVASASAFEKREVEDAITLASLRKAAAAMNCRLVYAIVPETSLEDAVHDRAGQIVDERLARTGHTMRLENQGVPAAHLFEERERMIETVLREEGRRIWRMAKKV